MLILFIYNFIFYGNIFFMNLIPSLFAPNCFAAVIMQMSPMLDQ